LKRHSNNGIAVTMYLRFFSVLLIAIAMLAAPLTMRDGMAMAAAAPAPHHGDAAQIPGHCADRGAPKQDLSHMARGDNCCIATCVAVMTPVGSPTLPQVYSLVLRLVSDADRVGTLAEIATPPPRSV
jgi:hypothetical protein